MSFPCPLIFEITPLFKERKTANLLPPILPMDDPVWEAYRPEIVRLYVKVDITLEELVKIMRVEYQFKKT